MTSLEQTEQNHDLNAPISPESIPFDGYEMVTNERVPLDVDLSKIPEQVMRTPYGAELIYKSVAGIRIGTDTEFADLEVFAVKNADGSDLYALRALDPKYKLSNVVPLKAVEGGIVGREGLSNGVPSFEDLPNTVSRNHVSIIMNEKGQLIVRNLDPTNTTTLLNLNPQEEAQNRPIAEMEATRWIDPVTGEETNGPTIDGTLSTAEEYERYYSQLEQCIDPAEAQRKQYLAVQNRAKLAQKSMRY